nr:MFS transporter [Polymorphobacter arshaanensis]
MGQNRVKATVLAAYSAPCLPLAAAGLPFVVYLPPYYSGPLGLSLSVVGLLFLMVRLIDVPLDPIVGHIIDRTTTRFGRYRPWVAGSAVMMVAGIALVFYAPPGLSPLRAFIGLLVMYVGYSTLQLAQTAWGATLSDDYHERSRVFGWWQMANVLGMVMMLMVPPLVAQFTPDNNHSAGIHAMGALVLVLLPLAVLAMLRIVPERAVIGGHAHRLRDMVAVLKIPLLRRLMVIDFLVALAAGMAGALLMFFFEAARGFTPAQSSLLLLIYFIAGLLAAPVWVALSRRIGKHRTLMLSLIIYALFQASLLFLPRGTFTLTAVAMALAGLPYAAAALLLRSMLADLSDAETVRTGHQRTGLFFATLIAVSKLGYALAVGLTYQVLDAIGFVAKLGEANTPDAVSGLVFMFAAPPAVLLAIAAALTARWPINAEQQARIAAELAARVNQPG